MEELFAELDTGEQLSEAVPADAQREEAGEEQVQEGAKGPALRLLIPAPQQGHQGPSHSLSDGLKSDR